MNKCQERLTGSHEDINTDSYSKSGKFCKNISFATTAIKFLFAKLKGTTHNSMQNFNM